MTPTEAFQQVWRRIYNPRSGCPDIEIDGVLDVMAEVLASTGPGTTNVERFILARVTIMGEARMGDIISAVQGQVSSYTVTKGGGLVSRDWADVADDAAAKTEEALAAIKALKERNALVEVEPELLRLA